NKIQNFLLYFSPETINEKQHVSLLGDEIQSASSKWNVKTLDSEITLDTVESSLKSENMIYDNKNNLALIMMPDIMILTQDKQQQMDFYKAFEKYLIESCDGLFIKYQIDILIFKAKLYLDNYFEEGFNNFLYLKKKYELKYLPHLSRINLPVELYLPIFKPNLILGAYGSALFYSKKLYPDVVTYSFDKWYNKYCDDHFGTHIKEYDTLINFFHGKYSKEFREILPIRF
ncbi:MAG: hypothetical protein Q8K40_06965, partial [Ignavibacteria bacterium]|nr:hypothetical protein [Ignavibacteria bacterium]